MESNITRFHTGIDIWILVQQPSKEEMMGIVHHMIDIVIYEDYRYCIKHGRKLY